MSAKRGKDADRLAAECEAQGFRVKRTTKGYTVYAKIADLGAVVFHRTPSDGRAEKNRVADLRRIGVSL